MRRWFVSVGGLAVMALQGASAGVIYFHPDHLGSMAVATSSAGAVQQIEHYTPFGETLNTLHSTLNTSHFQFTGQELDRESDLQNSGARYYDPTLARFHSRDVVVHNSPYAYVRNNPVRRIDPTGRSDQESTDIGNLRTCNNGVCYTLEDLQSVESESLTPVSDQMLDGINEAARDIGDWALALGDLLFNVNVSDACIAASGQTCVSQDPVPPFYGMAGMVGGSGLVAHFFTGSLFKSVKVVRGASPNYALIRLWEDRSQNVRVDVGLGRYGSTHPGNETAAASEIFGYGRFREELVVARINNRGYVYTIGDPSVGRVPVSREEAKGIVNALKDRGLIDLGQRQPLGNNVIRPEENTVIWVRGEVEATQVLEVQKKDGSSYDVLDVQDFFGSE